MNTKSLANHYAQLTPDELFRLIMAANSRGDPAERDRLAEAGQRITLSMPAHSPYARAFGELSFMTYIELLDEAAEYLDSHERAVRAVDTRMPKRKKTARRTKTITPDQEEPAAENSEDDAEKPTRLAQSYELVNAIGFFFKLNLRGWTLFCARWNAGLTDLWDHGNYPGLDRLKIAWALVQAGFAYRTPADAVCWLNTVRPADDPELTEANIMTAEWVADRHDAEFHERVRWWGG